MQVHAGEDVHSNCFKSKHQTSWWNR